MNIISVLRSTTCLVSYGKNFTVLWIRSLQYGSSWGIQFCNVYLTTWIFCTHMTRDQTVYGCNVTSIAIFHSISQYRISARVTFWSPHLRTRLTLFNLFRNLHCMYILGNGTSITIPCSTYNIPSLSKRRLLLHLSFLFNILKGVYSLPLMHLSK